MKLLTRDEVEGLGSFGRDVTSLWDDINVIVDRLLLCSAEESALPWHHLLLAVANFKANLKVYPPSLPRRVPCMEVARPESLIIPMATGPLHLLAEEPETWRELTNRIQGFGVSRASTLLAAFWPDRHIVVDWRSLSVAAALAGSRNSWDKSVVDQSSTAAIDVTWENYSWYRDAILETAQGAMLAPVDVERALYMLALEMPGVTWARYAEELERLLPNGRFN